jgi:2-dehydropantoate 2-reductase
VISASLDAEGRILHFNKMHGLTFGVRSGQRSNRSEAIQALMTGAPFDGQLSDNILQSMWEKWTFIAAAAGITCLMRAAIGDIRAAGGVDLCAQAYEECAQIASETGYPPSAPARELSLGILTAAGSPISASMLRDIENHGRIEGDHIIGDLLRRRKSPATGVSVMSLAHVHAKAYEERRKRELNN